MSNVPFQYNSPLSNMNVDNALATILTNFDSNYIMHAIQDSLDYKFRPYCQPLPNTVYAWEQLFKQYSDSFESNKDEIDRVRVGTYIEIINLICDYYNLQFNDIDQDYYSSAFLLYSVLVSNFTDNLIKFYTNYILKEKNFIYDNYNLGETRRNKDSSMLYSKKVFKNPKIGAIHANIDVVIDNMAYFDINLYNILDLIIEDKNIVRFLDSIISDKGDFFKYYLVPYTQIPKTRPDLITCIKLQLQKVAADQFDISAIQQEV